MKCERLFSLIFLWFVPLFISAQPSYMKDLEEHGYCVIPQVLSTSETEVLYQRVWHEYIEKAWPSCRMDDRSNWEEEFPMHNVWGLFAGPAGQTQVMWDLRQNPLIVEIFANIWNTKDLIVSMDGLSLMCPTEIRYHYVEPWPHVDQTVSRREDGFTHNSNSPMDFVSESLLSTQPFTIQGQFLFEDSFDGDGGFCCIPGSHLKFGEFAPELEAIKELQLSKEEKKKAENECLHKFFGDETDELGSSYRFKHITAPRGSLILWDSRTIHWGQFPRKDRPYSDNPKVRMVGFLCYVPKSRLTDEGRALRKEAFETGNATGHNPSYPEIKCSKDHTQQAFKHYLEDPSYVPSKPILTELGESLLGY